MPYYNTYIIQPPRYHIEMASQKRSELHGADYAGDPVERLQKLCLASGARDVMALGRLLRQLDKDGNKNVNLKQFTSALKGIGLEITNEEIKDVFNKFDTDGRGIINMDEFFIHIKPSLNEIRMNIIAKAFNKIDKTGNGEITIEELKKLYNVDSQCRYSSGQESQECILKSFLDHFEQNPTTDGKVSRDEFFTCYAAIGATMVDDSTFATMMKLAYHI